MANIRLTEREFDTFCYGALFIIEQFYKDPVNKAEFEEWKRSRKEQSNENMDTERRS